MSAGSMIEGDLPTEKKPETDRITVAKLLFGMTGLYERWRNEMEARRYPNGSGDADYERRLRELEEQIEHADREHYGFRIGGNYTERGGGRWDKWAMPGLVTLAVSGIIGNIVQAMAVSALKQEVEDLKSQVEHIEKLVEPRYRSG
jgi:hypothetical protein